MICTFEPCANGQMHVFLEFEDFLIGHTAANDDDAQVFARRAATLRNETIERVEWHEPRHVAGAGSVAPPLDGDAA